MDQVKIGRFIAQCRKANNMTQMQLAEKLGITDRAVSKWETGKSLPDVAIMPELCGLLNITINDLFNGEVVVMEDYKEKSEMFEAEIRATELSSVCRGVKRGLDFTKSPEYVRPEDYEMEVMPVIWEREENKKPAPKKKFPKTKPQTNKNYKKK